MKGFNIFAIFVLCFVILCLCFVLYINVVYSGDQHYFRVKKDGGGSYCITNFPKKLYNDPAIMIYLKCVTGIWTNGKISFPGLTVQKKFGDPLIEILNVSGQTLIDNNIVSTKRVVASSIYYPIYRTVIYLHPDLSNNKKIHNKIKDRLNNLLKEMENEMDP